MQIPHIEPIFSDAVLQDALVAAIDSKTKPIGSLGVLETLARQLGLIQRTLQPQVRNPTILVLAADHGIVAERVSAYPQDVTWQMVENFLAGGAAINVFARQTGCAVQIVDAGVNHDFGRREGLLDRKVGHGTRNFAQEPAMTSAECKTALSHGYALVAELDSNVVGFGEMGIGNTSAASALMHLLTGVPLPECVGAGAGLDADGVRHKLEVLERAMIKHRNVCDPLAVLAAVGGYEIAMMVGAMLAAAGKRMVLVVDGFIATSAVLVAARLQPAVLDYCVFAHCSAERGHAALLEHLEGRPILQLGMRLGEGSACALAIPILEAAVTFLSQMATFQSARVATRH